MKERLRGLPLRDLTILVVAIVLITAFNSLSSRTNQQRASDLDSYSTYDATTGGYRAWYELLQREKIGIERFEQRPAFLSSSLGALVWSEPLDFDPRQISNSQADIRALEDWVKAGGRLIYLGHDDQAAKQGILKLPRTFAPKTPPKNAARRTPAPIRIASDLRSQGIGRIALDNALRWKTPKRATVLLSDASGVLALSYSYGKGRIVAVLDETAFDNANIAHADNARLAFALATPPRAGARVAFDEAAHGYLVPERWWQIMPRPLLIALVVVALAIGLAFVGNVIRLGPPIVPPARTDASSAEFIDSLAVLFERGHAAGKALEEVVHSTARTVAVAVGLPDDAAPSAIARRIEDPELRRAYLELADAADAPALDEKRLVSLVASAQKLRKEFSSYARSRH